MYLQIFKLVIVCQYFPFQAKFKINFFQVRMQPAFEEVE